MRAARISWSVLLLFLICLLTLPAAPASTLAQGEDAGILAVFKRATGDAPALVRFFTPDSQLIHELPLPEDIAISGAALAPDGRHLVYLSGAVSGPETIGQADPLQADLTLHIIRTADGGEEIAVPLLPINFPNNIGHNASLLVNRDPSLGDASQIAEAVWQAFKFSLGTFAWSPDGKLLAFSAATDGPSSDLYLYDTTTGTISRLTDGIEQIDGIRWSPTGRWIWHSTISYGYCQVCDGHHFAAAADGSGVVNLPGNDIFRFLAWIDGDSYLVTDQANGPGDFALQRVDVPTGNSAMLWAGTHQNFVYDAAMNRLGIIGTRGRTFDPDEQVFIVDLTTGEDVEYDDLTSALAVEKWLLPLSERPTITHPCHRSGPIVSPCIVTPFDPLSPNGQFRVTDYYSVVEEGTWEMLLPYGGEIPPHGGVLWRPDNAGFFISQSDVVLYRDYATGDFSVTDYGSILTWLPHATSNTFATTAPRSVPVAPAPDGRPAATPTAGPTGSPTPVATAVIDIPYRNNTLVGSFPDTAFQLRRAHSSELATIAATMSTSDIAADLTAREQGLHLLLAHEAAATYRYPYSVYYGDTGTPDPDLEARLSATLDAALLTAPASIATYPPGGNLPNAYSLAVSPDGTLIATGHDDGAVRLWDYATGALRRVLPTFNRSIREIQFSHDGTLLAATSDVGQAQMWFVDSGIKSSTHFGHELYLKAIAWRPNSEDLAVADDRDTVMIHPRGKNAYPLLDPALNLSAEALAYSPDGSLLAIALQPSAPRQGELPIWVVDADTGEQLYEFADDGLTSLLTFTPDGKTLLATSGYTLRAWDIATGSLRFESKLQDFPYGGALTLDGAQLAILSRSGTVSFYATRDGANVRNLAVDASILSGLVIHPVDGQLITTDTNGRPLVIDPTGGTLEFRFQASRARIAAVSPVAPLFATADVRVITLHDLNTQRPLRELRGALNLVIDLAFSMDGKWLAAREETGYLAVWEVERGNLLWRAAVSGEWGGRVAFTPGGDLLAGGSDGVLRLVDAQDGAILGEASVNAAIQWITVSRRNEATIGIGRPDSIAVRVTLDEFAENRVKMQTVAEAATIRSPAAYSPDGARLAVIQHSGSGNAAMLVSYDTESGAPVQAIEMGEVYSINGTAFSPDGKTFATGAFGDQPITLWNHENATRIRTFGDGSTTHATTRLAFTADGTQLLVSDEQGVTTQYGVLPSPALRTIPAHRGSVWDVAVSPDGRWAATAGDDQHVRLWNWQTGEELTHVINEPARVYSVDFSPNNDGILTGGYEGEIHLYYAGGSLQRTRAGHTSWIIDAIFRPDGRAFATASQDGSVRAWNRARATLSWSVEGLPMGVGAIAYSPDSNFLAGSAGSGPNTTIYIWDAYSGEEVRQLHGHANYVIGLAFSPDGTLLASASWDHTIKLWDVATGDEVATLAGHREILTDLAFSPDGTRLASIAEDYTLRLWDVATHTEQRRIDMPRTLPWAVAFSRDGHALLTTHADGTLRTWLTDVDDSSLGAKMYAVAARVPRATATFTLAERNTYAIDSQVGGYSLSASGNVNWRAEPYIKSLIVQPNATGTTTETLIALTDEKFLLTSTDRGESWRIVTRLPLTLTYYSLGMPARPTDPLLITSDQGLYRVADDGALTLVYTETRYAVSYSHTDPDTLWSVYGTVHQSEDGGVTWEEGPPDLQGNYFYAPLIVTPPDNYPLFVMSTPFDARSILWRGASDGAWERLDALPPLPNWITRDQTLAWDAASHTLYFSDARGHLYATTHADTLDATDVTATIVESFGHGTRPIPLAIGEGPSLYLNLITTSRPSFLRGTWDGNTWQWVEIRLPLVAAG